MDFVTYLPRFARGHCTIWVTVNRLTKCANFLSITQKILLDKMAHLYIRDIVRLNGVPMSINFDRDLSFTSRF